MFLRQNCHSLGKKEKSSRCGSLQFWKFLKFLISPPNEIYLFFNLKGKLFASNLAWHDPSSPKHFKKVLSFRQCSFLLTSSGSIECFKTCNGLDRCFSLLSLRCRWRNAHWLLPTAFHQRCSPLRALSVLWHYPAQLGIAWQNRMMQWVVGFIPNGDINGTCRVGCS